MRWPLALLLLTAPSATAAGVDVQVHSGRVDLKLSGGPLSEVLDRLASTLKFQLTREDGVPNPVLPALELKDRTPAEAVLAVLDGQGINYAITLDASGSRVESLLLTAAKSTATPSRPQLPGRGFTPRSIRPMPSLPPDESEEDTEPEVVLPPPPEEEPTPPPAAPPPATPGNRPGPNPQPTP